MIQNHVDKNTKTARVHQKITHDFVLDIYEQSLHVEDQEQRDAIVETARVLSQCIGEFLVNDDTSDKNNKKIWKTYWIYN